MKLSLRDPLAWAAVVEALAVLLLGLDVFGLDAQGVALWMAVVNGVVGLVTAVFTKRTGFSLALGLVRAVISLLAWYGLKLDEQDTLAVIAVATVVLNLFGWTQNSPAEKASLKEELT